MINELLYTNYKGISKRDIKDFTKLNLISGDSCLGKTSILEILQIILSGTSEIRKNLYLEESNEILIRWKEGENIFQKSFPFSEKVKETTLKVPIISGSNSFNRETLYNEFIRLKHLNKTNDLLNILKEFDSVILDLESDDFNRDVLVKTVHTKKFIPLSLMGDSIKTLLQILFQLLLSSNPLLIDNIEVNLHFTWYPILWKTFNNFPNQVFAVTNNLEMIYYFVASQEINQDKSNSSARFFEACYSLNSKIPLFMSREIDLMRYILRNYDNNLGAMNIRGTRDS